MFKKGRVAIILPENILIVLDKRELKSIESLSHNQQWIIDFCCSTRTYNALRSIP